MGVYLDRLQAEFDEITAGIDARLERAAADGRDLTDDENAQLEREDARRDQLAKAIDHQAALLERSSKVAAIIGRVRGLTPATTRVRDGGEQEPEFDLAREVGPTPGHWAALVHAATAKHDPKAIALLERATVHQTTGDNPGLIPRPLVAPVIDRMRTMRPLIASIGARPAPAEKFDRPIVSQHVAVDVQTAQKDPTASQKMLVGKVPVELATYAGHLNIARQDIRWSQPGILALVYESFAKVYARRTDKQACVDFAAAVTETQDIEELTAGGIDTALGAVGSTVETADGDMGELNHMWMSRDVATALASMRSPLGTRLYNLPVAGGTSGDIDGIKVTIDPRFVAGTWIAGDDALVEFYEDLEGFLTVDEPDVLGQLVGYAGYTDLVVLDATGFVRLTIPPAAPEAARLARAKRS